MKVQDILNRRTDLSTFLVHLTRDSNGSVAEQNLEGILNRRKIEARTVYGHLKKKLEARSQSLASQTTVCFTETPLELSYLLLETLEEKRECKFEPYGIAITKRLGRKLAVNPVWYVDMTPGSAGNYRDWLTNDLDKLADEFLSGSCSNANLERLFPFFEQMGTWNGSPKEFWWEREWRHVGDFTLPSTLICLCPAERIEHFEKVLKQNGFAGACLDPRWSLEKMIARLAGFSDEEINVIQ